MLKSTRGQFVVSRLTFLDSRDSLEEEEERRETDRFKEDDLDLCCSSSLIRSG